MTTHEAAHGTRCRFPGCATGLNAVHHVFVADRRRQGDMCAYHTPYEVER